MSRPLIAFSVGSIVAVLIQTSLAGHLGMLPAPPDIMTLLVVYLGLHHHTAGGAIGAFLLGYLLDTFSGSPPGLYCFALLLVFGSVGLLARRMWIENPITRLAIAAAGLSVKTLVVATWFAVAASARVPWPVLLRTLAAEALLGLLVAPFVFPLLDRYLRPATRRGARAAQRA